MKFSLRLLALLALVVPTVSAAEPHAYRVARLWPGDAPPIVDAVLVIRDGKILAVGRRAEVKLPADAIVHELGEATIIPGLIAAETTLAERGRDDLLALSPHHRSIDGFDFYADYTSALSGGVTTVQIAPGGRRLLPGQGAVVKLKGDAFERRTLREEESLRIVLGDAFKSPPRIYEPPVGAVSVDRPLDPTRPQLAGSLASAVAGLRATFRAAREVAPERADALLRAVASSGSATKPVRVTAPGAADVQAALSLAREFQLRLVLVEPAVARDQLASWKGHVDGVVLSTGVRPGVIGEGPGQAPAETARDLRAAGLRVALKPSQDADLKDLLYLGGLLTTRVAAVDVLRMLTADAAALLGVADRVGTLAPGKDADFVVLSGEPFALHTRVRAVHVDGQNALEAKAASQRKVVRAGRVLTGTGEVLTGGSVLIDGRTVRAVGREVALPLDTEERRFSNAVIVPGFMDLGTGLGVGGPLNSTVAITTRLGDRLARGDAGMRSARQGGITTALLAAQAPSPVVAYKLTDIPRPVKDPVALRLAVRGNLTSAGASLRDQLRAAKAYADGWTKYEADLAEFERKARSEPTPAKPSATPDKKPEPPKPPEKPQTIESLEPFRPLLAGKLPALVEARREDAIRLAVAICRDEFNLRTVLVGAEDAPRVADLLAAKSVSVIAGPELIRTVEREEVNLPLSLTLRGVPFGFQSQAMGGSRNLPLAVGYSVRQGLGTEDALRGLTVSAAQIAGLESQGTLATGKDADLVVLSGMPFELSTRVLAVMIDGQWVFQE